MQQEIEQIINTTTYTNFFRSDIYIEYIQHVQSDQLVTISTSSSSGSCSVQEHMPRSLTLPTLHEDKELTISDDFASMKLDNNPIPDIPMRLTREMLLATARNRSELRPQG